MPEEPNQNPTSESQTSQLAKSNSEPNTSEAVPHAETTTSQSNTPNSQATENSSNSKSFSDSQTKEDKEEPTIPKSPPNRLKIDKKQRKILMIGAGTANQIQSPIGDMKPEDAKNRNIGDIGDGGYSEENEFDYISTEWLQIRLDIVKKEIDTKNEEDNNLTDSIEYTVNELMSALGREKFTLKRVQQRYEKERKICRELRQNLEKQFQKIKKELEDREQKKRKVKEDSERTQSISANFLFKSDDSIIHTILYVATFFPDLSPNEFQSVVSSFLSGLTTEKTNQKKVIEEDKTRIIETSEEQSLVDIWEKSFSQPDQYLEKCYIKVRRQEKSSLVIDFSLPYLRSELKTYFREEQPLYVAERLKKVPQLLFDNSENVADRAINLLAEAAVDYPDAYEAEWLLRVREAVENINDERLFKRLSKLIYQMQTWLDPSKSEQMITTFFDRLLLAERHYAFGIVLHLIFRHLCSSWLFNRIELSQQLLDWLKQVLDKSDQLDDNKKRENIDNVYAVLETLLWQEEKTSSYIYDLLEILKDWLPEKGISSEDYSSSNQVALFLLATYCEQTLFVLEPNDYGKWPSPYPLFTSLSQDISQDISQDSEDSNSACSLKLNILVSWLFHSDTDTNSSKNRERNLAFGSVLTIKAIDWIGFLIGEWFAILCGQRNDSKNRSASADSSKDTPKPSEAAADNLIRQIILLSEPSEQKGLNECWANLANAYLDEAEKCANSGEESLKQELVFRRKLVKDLRKRFQALQKETLAVK